MPRATVEGGGWEACLTRWSSCRVCGVGSASSWLSFESRSSIFWAPSGALVLGFQRRSSGHVPDPRWHFFFVGRHLCTLHVTFFSVLSVPYANYTWYSNDTDMASGDRRRRDADKVPTPEVQNPKHATAKKKKFQYTPVDERKETRRNITFRPPNAMAVTDRDIHFHGASQTPSDAAT